MAEAQVHPDAAQLNEGLKAALLRRYDKLVQKADRLNPPPKKRKLKGPVPQNSPPLQPTPRRLINRLQRRRDEVLRFISDLSVPFDNNGSERYLRMVKLQQRFASQFKVATKCW